MKSKNKLKEELRKIELSENIFLLNATPGYFKELRKEKEEIQKQLNQYEEKKK